MKLEKDQFEDVLLGAEKEMSFSIDDENPIIFEILRNKMYADKIGSICREVASNSRDANREAGNASSNIDIEIVTPGAYDTITDLSICFRDRGIGITPDRMENVFIRYASSTKRDSNSQTGGFGLGAKTPFAYTDTFTIVTVCDWEGKRLEFTYSAMIDSTQKGKMILFEVCETEEVTGTRIIIPIKDVDRDEFERKVRYTTSLWNNVELINFERTSASIDKLIDETDFIVIQETSEINNTYNLNIDGVIYPLDIKQVGLDKNRKGLGSPLLLNFNVGELTISANRESVQYDTETIEAIKNKLDLVRDHIAKMTASKISKANSFIEACIGYKNISNRSWVHDDNDIVIHNAYDNEDRHYGNNGLCAGTFTETEWNDKLIVKSLKIKHHQVVILYNDDIKNGKIVYNRELDLGHLQAFLDHPIYLLDGRKDFRKSANILKDNSRFILIIPKKNSSDKEISDEQCLMGLEYELDIQSYNDVERIEVEGSELKRYTKTDYVDVKVKQLNYKKRYDEYSYMSNTLYDFHRVGGFGRDNREYCYLVVDSLKEDDIRRHHEIYKAKVVDRLTDKVVIMINSQAYNRYFINTNMMSVQDVYQSIITNRKDFIIEKRSIGLMKDVLSNIPELLLNNAIQIFPKWIQNAIYVLHHSEEVDIIFDRIRDVEVKFNRKALEKKIDRTVYTKYPMLKLYCAGYSDQFWRRADQMKVIDQVNQDIKDYIALIDNSLVSLDNK